LKDIYYIGDSQQLKIVYDAALLDNSIKLGDKTFKAAILSRTSNTNTEKSKESNTAEEPPKVDEKKIFFFN
jgi:hypothetical protein